MTALGSRSGRKLLSKKNPAKKFSKPFVSVLAEGAL
jgi:hypothetical protein